MPKQLLKGLLLMLVVVFAAGCASSKKTTTGGGVTTRAYITDKERVDQAMEGGNFGYLAGTPQAEDRTSLKKTRKVYVVEVTKEPPELSDDTTTTTTTTTESTTSYRSPFTEESAQAEEPRGRKIELPRFDEDSPRSAPAAASDDENAPVVGGQAYTVEKDDTLQKISKKFYGTYSKWPQIYEANKNVIQNPNRIKQGVTLQIP